MMKLLMIMICLLITQRLLAFEYQIEKEQIANPSISTAYELKTYFEKFSYNSFADRDLLKAGFLFDQAFSDYQFKKSFVIKAGLGVSDKIEGKLIHDQKLGVHVFHFRFKNIPYMLMAFDFEEKELKNILHPWLREEKVSLLSFFINSAHAETCEENGTNQFLHKTSRAIESNEILKAIGKCGLSALQGLGEAVDSKVDFFEQLATNPSAVWTETKKSFVEFKKFILNFQTELEDIYSNLKGVSLEQKIQMACTFTGQLIAMSGQALITGGIASSQLLPALLLKLKTVSSTFKELALLEKYGFKLSKTKLDEVIQCSIK